MRPTKNPQSALRCPANHLLGTEANVRVLRAVLLSPVPIGIAELARQTELQASGLPRVCDALEDLGIIEAVGRGRNRQFWRRAASPLLNQLTNLFNEERARAERILTAVRGAAQSLSGAVRAAWIEGPIADQTDRPGDAITVGMLVGDARMDELRNTIWEVLLRIQETNDITVELSLVTEADLRAADDERLAVLSRAMPLLGAPPTEIARPRPEGKTPRRAARPRRHEDVDARLRALADAIAEHLRTNPGLVDDAKRYVERRLLTAQGSERLALREWKQMLETSSIPRLRRLLTRDDAQARRLRQSLPFVNALTPEERTALMKDSPPARRKT